MTSIQASETITNKWSRLYGSLFLFLGRAMMAEFGLEGEKALRRAVHDYGTFRARHMRADHDARGVAINLANLQNHGDMPNTDSLESENRVCTPDYFRVTVTECTLYDTWRELDGLDVGRIYCAQVHHPLYCGYADGVTLDLSNFLTKGDPHCTFILTYAGTQDFESPTEAFDYGGPPETKIARLYGVLYCFLAKAMLDTFGARGEIALRQALRDYARHEADSLTEDHLARGWRLEAGNIPALMPAQGYETVAGQAVLDAWREVEGQKIPLGLIYFEEIHRAV